MANDKTQPGAPVRFLDITISLTGDENRLICAAISRAHAAGMLRDFLGQVDPNILTNIFNKVAAASAEQGDPFAQHYCLRADIPFGGGTGTAQ
ncbi:hypothetical protein WT81_33385 [Burkholderia stagnalis]|uniref:hypothetical protein n=1 Tax=Burkholderia stagnalis TaxID=1503054 RepID=UPI00075F85A8|nr:hypothetical protein [Burkholderia stagnalis]KWK50425.1 hypothetical protein WT80_00790 [Burkholderia stagnalis]KWK65188.1 hypothetical protein WT81_33385 [Burkholderia stagnalis]KWN76513.1 hypothetical protein WT90_00625 [Burkholderia stagnalis]